MLVQTKMSCAPRHPSDGLYLNCPRQGGRLERARRVVVSHGVRRSRYQPRRDFRPQGSKERERSELSTRTAAFEHSPVAAMNPAKAWSPGRGSRPAVQFLIDAGGEVGFRRSDRDLLTRTVLSALSINKDDVADALAERPSLRLREGGEGLSDHREQFLGEMDRLLSCAATKGL